MKFALKKINLCIRFKNAQRQPVKPDSLGCKPDDIIKLMFAESKDRHGANIPIS
jgi:hypothetical protein